MGRPAIGADLAPAAVAAARANLPPGTPLLVADAAALPLRSGAVGAVVANPPFGLRHAIGGDPARWLRTVFAELERVVARGGAIVLLQPASAVVKPRAAALRSRHPIELLGLRTTIWVFGVRQ